jgi:hypothetical protein
MASDWVCLEYLYPPPVANAPAGASAPSVVAQTESISAGASGPERPKRKQVKQAVSLHDITGTFPDTNAAHQQCTNCATACKRCDDARPCQRCVKYGTADTCVDGKRKERQKGIKRGPYKRRNKDGMPDASAGGGTYTLSTRLPSRSSP